MEFEFTLEENILKLHKDLQTEEYYPAPYKSFYIADPKLRHIHKASVRDRVVHQAIFRILDPVFDKTFIHDSYSCRINKGTHAGVRQLRRYMRKASCNFLRPAYALKCDIKKFFSSIDHTTLIALLGKRINDPGVLNLLKTIILGYEEQSGKALPLGNVTSQLFANVYLNELDQYAKHILKARYYLRYCDDFILLSPDKEELIQALSYMKAFLKELLVLDLHPRKVELRKLGQGIDFLGYVVMPHATLVRTRTKKRLFRKLSLKNLPSYLGVLEHANTERLKKRVKEIVGE